MASAEGVSIGNGGGIEINFDRADIQAVAKTLLGDTLGINVVVDPRVQGTVTLAATGPIPRKDVLPVFESVLRMSNVAVVREANLVKIVPVAEATGTGVVEMGDGQAGFGVSVVPLRYVSAAAVAKTAENFLARPGALNFLTHFCAFPNGVITPPAVSPSEITREVPPWPWPSSLS